MDCEKRGHASTFALIFFWDGVLGGSWVVLSAGISRVTKVITHIRGLITPLITTHEPPSRDATTDPSMPRIRSDYLRRSASSASGKTLFHPCSRKFHVAWICDT